MNARLKLGFLTAAIAAMGLLLVPGALAQDYPPAEDDFVTCTPDPATPGTDVECEAGFFQAGSEGEWSATFSTGEVLSGTFTADGEGVAAFGFGVPEDADGSYEISVAGIGPDGEPKVLSETNEVAEAPAGDGDEDAVADGDEDAAADEELSATGSDTATYAIGALLILGLGAGALYSTRKKSKASA